MDFTIDDMIEFFESEHDCCERDNCRGRILGETYCCIHGCVTGVCEDFVYGYEE